MAERTVLVTGGSSGIGAATVRIFALDGFRVFFTYNTGEDRARQVIESLPQADIGAFHLDQGSLKSHEKLLVDIPEPVDILVNNAGLGSKTVEKVSDDVYEQDEAMLRVNALGPLWLTRRVLPGMLERRWGKIIFISSVGGGISQFPGFHWADGMSKAALAYLGKHVQAENATSPVDIFTVCPGATETPMFEASALSGFDKDERKKFIKSLPGGRLIEPEEIARLVLFLTTDKARVLRGSVLDASLGLGVHPGAITGGEK